MTPIHSPRPIFHFEPATITSLADRRLRHTNEGLWPSGGVKMAQQNGVLLQGNQHLANQVKLQLPSDEVSDQTVAMTVIEAMPHYDQLL